MLHQPILHGIQGAPHWRAHARACVICAVQLPHMPDPGALPISALTIAAKCQSRDVTLCSRHAAQSGVPLALVNVTELSGTVDGCRPTPQATRTTRG